MPPSSRRDERLSIFLTPEEKARWNYYATFYESHGDALMALMDAYGSSPEELPTAASQ